MTANVEIVAATRHDVVMAPMLSLFDKDDKTCLTVVKDNNATEDREVQVGIDDGDNAEITSGLSAGEKILVHHNNADSKWMGTHGKSAGAAKKKSADKKKSDKNAKNGDSTTDNPSAKQKKDKDSSRANKKNSKNKNSDDSSDDADQ